MNELLTALLGVGALSSLRQDEAVARQGVMNHQTSAHFMDLMFVRDANEMSIPESYAVQGLAMSQLPRETAGLRTSIHVPTQDAPAKA